ncbi:DoxX family protein [Sinorhizobium medicae]|uniref:DoxX family protein n=1 Tax=Sinorhizobium medicae TaxID=110321 RepID=UPI000C7B8C81|nr:DoxX family protein [Sinorhizobium medicae]PLU42064.1 DoxX family protein [Sinorhizobium medicae]
MTNISLRDARPVRSSVSGLHFLALLALCSAYIQGPLIKIFDFSVYRRAAALALALFTFATTFIAFRFWDLQPGLERSMAMNGFFEHFGLVGAFVLVALYEPRRRPAARRSFR